MKKYLWQIIITPAQLVIALLLIVSWFIATPAEAQQPDSWQRKQYFPAIPAPRIVCFTFTIGDKGYVGTGHAGVHKADFWEFDPVNETWTQKAAFPEEREFAIGFSVGGKGYAGMGIYGNLEQSVSVNDLWEYDPVANQWTGKSAFPSPGVCLFSLGSKEYVGRGKELWAYEPGMEAWTRLGDLPGGGGAIGFSIGDKGYLGGSVNDFWEYDPATDSWTQKNNFPSGAVYLHLAAGLKGYLGIDSKELWEYEPTGDSWTRRADYTADYWGDNFAFAAGGRIYVGNDDQKNNFREFNPANNTWKGLPDLQEQGRVYATGFTIGNKGYFGTGAMGYFGGVLCRDFWEYDPVLDSWTQKANFGGTARERAVGLSIGGKGYIATGRDSSGDRNDFWEYDRDSNTWVQKGDYPGGSVSNANGFTVGNKGYIVEQTNHRLWEYDPATGQWTQKAANPLLNAGGVSFAIGNKGYCGGGGYQDFFEYDPVTDAWTMKASIIKTLDESHNFIALNGAGFSIGNKGYLNVGLWQSDGGPYPSHTEHFYEYDPQMDEWVDRAISTVTRRTGATGISIGNKGYVCFGFAPPLRADLFMGGSYTDLWEYTPPGANTITAQVTATEFCSLKTFSIPYTVSGTFNADNTFTAQLSDSSGSFDNAITIGNVNGIASGIITATIPRNIPRGTAYRIRVISSSPAITGAPSEGNLSINPPPVVNTKNLTVYLNRNGQVSITPGQVNNGSTAYCGGLNLQLDKTRFDCTDIGANTVTLTGKDCNGNIGNNTAIITVLDTIRPVIRELSAYPRYLWPPNNKLKEVNLSYKAADNCRVKSIVLSVASNEPPQPGRPDWIIINNHQVLLRAARSDREQERTYTISITATDGCGNNATEQVTVSVAHRRKHHHHNSYQPTPGNAFREQDSEEALVTQAFTVTAYPNPAAQHFTIISKSDNKEPISFRIMDAAGRVIEERSKIAPNSTVQLGERYLPGIYYLQAIQQKKTVTLVLVKGAQ